MVVSYGGSELSDLLIKIIRIFGDYILEIIPIFILAILIAAILEEFLTIRFVERFVSSKNILVVLASSFVGAIIPLCTCGMIPLASSLRRKNAHWVPLLAFLTAGVASSIPALLTTLILGWKITLLRLITAWVFGIGVAYTAGLSFTRKALKGISPKKNNHGSEGALCCELCEHRQEEHFFSPTRWKEVARDFLAQLKEFSPWLLGSLLAAALISAIVHKSIIEILLGANHPYSSFFASAIGLPFYLCAGADVPLAKALLAKGASLGSVLAFMNAAPTLNLPAVSLLGKWLGKKAMFQYLFICWLTASIIGFFINIAL